jgi:hypothetical protein
MFCDGQAQTIFVGVTAPGGGESLHATGRILFEGEDIREARAACNPQGIDSPEDHAVVPSLYMPHGAKEALAFLAAQTSLIAKFWRNHGRSFTEQWTTQLSDEEKTLNIRAIAPSTPRSVRQPWVKVKGKREQVEHVDLAPELTLESLLDDSEGRHGLIELFKTRSSPLCGKLDLMFLERQVRMGRLAFDISLPNGQRRHSPKRSIQDPAKMQQIELLLAMDQGCCIEYDDMVNKRVGYVNWFLLGLVDAFYDQCLRLENPSCMNLLLHGPGFQQISDEELVARKDKRQALLNEAFSRKYDPKPSTAQQKNRTGCEAKAAPAKAQPPSATKKEEANEKAGSAGRASAIALQAKTMKMYDLFEARRITVKFTDLKGLDRAVKPHGWVKERSKVHVIYRRQRTEDSRLCPTVQRVTVPSTTSDNAHGWRNIKADFNKKEREWAARDAGFFDI